MTSAEGAPGSLPERFEDVVAVAARVSLFPYGIYLNMALPVHPVLGRAATLGERNETFNQTGLCSEARIELAGLSWLEI